MCVCKRLYSSPRAHFKQSWCPPRLPPDLIVNPPPPPSHTPIEETGDKGVPIWNIFSDPDVLAGCRPSSPFAGKNLVYGREKVGLPSELGNKKRYLNPNLLFWI